MATICEMDAALADDGTTPDLLRVLLRDAVELLRDAAPMVADCDTDDGFLWLVSAGFDDTPWDDLTPGQREILADLLDLDCWVCGAPDYGDGCGACSERVRDQRGDDELRARKAGE